MKALNMQEIQQVSLEILKQVADICDEQGLRYFLAYGTLIGAIRHKNTIPWDDDIDIMMPRPDYDKLLRYFESHKEQLYPLQAMNDDTAKDYPYLITRISDARYELDVINEKPYGIGVFIDIYPLDGLGNNLDEAKATINKTKDLSSLVFLATRKYFHRGNTKSLLKCVVKVPAFVYAKLRGKKAFSKVSYEIAKKYEYETSKYVGCVLWPTYRERDIFERNLFEETVKVQFGKYEFAAPKEYDTVLRQIYRDYMKLPPEKDRAPHHLYSAYKKG